jgi:hypothetical protein
MPISHKISAVPAEGDKSVRLGDLEEWWHELLAARADGTCELHATVGMGGRVKALWVTAEPDMSVEADWRSLAAGPPPGDEMVPGIEPGDDTLVGEIAPPVAAALPAGPRHRKT